MDTNLAIMYLAVIIFIYIFGRVFILPIKSILKLLLNSLIGAIGMYIVNLIGVLFEFHIGINIFTMLFVGVLGIPGTILMIIMTILI